MKRILLDVKKFYKSIDSYSFSEIYNAWCAAKIIQFSGIDSSHTVADIGGGSGDFAHQVHIRTKSQQQYHLIEPYTKVTCNNPNLIVHQYDALTFSKSLLAKQCDCWILKESGHHFKENLAPFMRSAYEVFSENNGFMIVVTREHINDYPICDAPKQVFVNEANIFIPALTKEATAAGFKLEQYSAVYKHMTTKSYMCRNIRERFLTTFSDEVFSEAQLEEQIREMQQRPDEDFIFPDTFVIYVIKI